MAFLVFALIVLAVAASGAMFSPGDWYAGLSKPAWTPPNWVFGPVWTALYVMIAAAGWLVWRAGERGRALGFWTANVIANGLWSWLFFGLRMPAIAFADILVIWATIVGFIVAAWSRSRTASLLFVPYLVWVSYASALNLAIWQMNR